MQTLRFEQVLTPDGLMPAQISVDHKGRIVSVEAVTEGPWDGWVALPGMINAHSHSFQRAMCGLAEQSAVVRDFWGWRETMYRIAQRLTPDDQYCIAHQVFREMLGAGYTSVGEFHYLHHLPDGQRGPQMAEAVVAAARDAGIRLALLPVFYQRGGFGRPAQPLQHRFVHETASSFLDYVAALGPTVAGVAPHSLRAVDVSELPGLVRETRRRFGAAAVMHIHIAEQRREVADSLAATGKTPIALLAERCELDARWSLVHATHASDAELAQLVAADVNVVLCPLTEANLGDGIFAVTEFQRRGGRFAIGSDCNARIDAVEELRMLEYGQRLVHQSRVALAGPAGPGVTLWAHAAATGARALNLNAGQLAAGYRADLVVLQRSAPLSGVPAAQLLDALLTGGSAANIGRVYVDGQRVATARGPEPNAFLHVLQHLAQPA